MTSIYENGSIVARLKPLNNDVITDAYLMIDSSFLVVGTAQCCMIANVHAVKCVG